VKSHVDSIVELHIPVIVQASDIVLLGTITCANTKINRLYAPLSLHELYVVALRDIGDLYLDTLMTLY
jgi:hypothetical protein